MNVKRNTSTVVQDTDIVLVEIHQHIGGVNYSVEHWRDGKFLGILCEATPVYGNGTQVGNEDGYVVKIPTCEFPSEEPYSVKKGDELVLTSLYNGRHIEGGGPYHEGVMGLLLYWGERTGPSDCESKLKEKCGDPLPKSTQECYECAERHAEELAFAECGVGYGWPIVQFLCLTDNGVKTPYPINQTTIEITKEMKNEIKHVKMENISIEYFHSKKYGMNGMGEM